MESPVSWDLLTASLAVTDLQRPFAAWAFLVTQGLVRDTPGDRDVFADASRREIERGPITGPSLACRLASVLTRAGIALPAGHVPDPGGLTAAQRLGMIAWWGDTIVGPEHREDLKRFLAGHGNSHRWASTIPEGTALGGPPGVRDKRRTWWKFW